MSIRKAIIIVFALFYSFLSYGQQNGQQWEIIKSSNHPLFRISYYAETGCGLSVFHSSDKSKLAFSPFIGFQIGGGINVLMHLSSAEEKGAVAAQAGVLYSRFGFSILDEKIRGGYFCFPFSFQYYPIKQLYVELDMEPCLNLGLSPDTLVIQNSTLDFIGHKANDFKVGVGAGYVFDYPAIGIAARMLFGTSDFAENLHWKGNVYSISVFYRFGNKK